MKRMDAQLIAARRWSIPGSRIGRAWLRCNAALRCEVGYESRTGKRGGWVDTVLGRGQTWEEAFEDAKSRERQP